MTVTKGNKTQGSVHVRQDHTEHTLDTGTPDTLVRYPLLMEAHVLLRVRSRPPL